MFGWLKERLVTWAEEHQRLETARLKKKSQRLSEEIEQATGQPFRLTSEELRKLAEKAKGMEREQLREVSVLHPEDLEKLIEEIDSAEDRSSEAP